jgi:Protein kinase domain/Caspase domain
MTLPDPARSRVVLIGASRFSSGELPDLPAVRNNLDELARCLRGIGRCAVVADPESPVALVDAVHDAATEAEDTLIVYYAGHGLVHPRTLGLLLAVVGSAPGRTHTAVPYDQVRECLLDSPAARKVVILDCCYSGRAFGGMADPTTAVANEAIVEGTYLLASAPPNKQSLSPPGERFTAFTGALVNVLRKGIPDGPEHLRLDLIYRHVRDTLRRAALPEPQLRTANTAGELALIRNPWRRAVVVEPIPEVPIVDLGVETPSVRERVKRLVRQLGADKSYVCPVCRAIVNGQNFVRHFDKHSQLETGRLDPATLALEIAGAVPLGLLAGRYELGELIGSGGRIKVYRAIDRITEQAVIVKQLPASGFDDRIGRINHPAIARVVDLLVKGPVAHIVLEYVPGRILSEVLAAEGPMLPQRATRIAADICGALAYAHGQGIVHGAINSRNVIVGDDDTVKLLNLGTSGGTKPRVDLYLTGRLLGEMLTGIPVTLETPVPQGFSPHLDSILRTALHPDLAERYQTAGEFMRALTQ